MALRQLADEKITINTAVGFTESEYFSNAKSDIVKVVCTVETAPIRINMKSTPTTAGAEGSPLLNPGDRFEVVGYDDIKNFKAVKSGSTNAVLMCLFFGAP